MSVYSSGVRSIRSAVRGTRRWSDESMYVSILPPQGSGASSSRSGLPGTPSVRMRSRVVVVRRMRLRTVVLAPMKSFCPEAESFDATRGVDSKLDAPVQHTQHAPMCSRGPSPATSFVPLSWRRTAMSANSVEKNSPKLVCLLCVGGGHLVKASDMASFGTTSRRTSNC